MSFLLKGALVQYNVGLGSPMPTVVAFQFNPESITRTLEIPPRPTGASLREVNQAGDVPIEKISLTAHFYSQEDSVRTSPVTLAYGIGPQLAALESMILPAGGLAALVPQPIDAIAGQVAGAGTQATQSIPRETYPRILFIWGATRVIPVAIDSMSIVEKQYDPLLNPTLAEVNLTMTAIIPDPCTNDPIAAGAYQYSATQRDMLAALNLSTEAIDPLDLVQF